MAEDKVLTYPELEEYIDLVTTNTQNLLNQLKTSNNGVLADPQNKQGMIMMAITAGNALIMERLTEYLRDKRSNILVTTVAPKSPLVG